MKKQNLSDKEKSSKFIIAFKLNNQYLTENDVLKVCECLKYECSADNKMYFFCNAG